MLNKFKDQRGIAHVAIVIGILILIAVAGLIVWRVSNPQSNPLSVFEGQADCASGDANICKFLSSWSADTDYRVVSTQTADGDTSTSIYETSNSGTRYHAKIEMGDSVYETISIDNVLYTKDTNSDKWWKQVTDNTEEVTDQDQDVLGDFNENVVESEEGTSEDMTEYKSLGTEQCGDLTCYKYQIITPSDNGTSQFIWFDNKDYKLRKMSSEAPSSTSVQEFSYDNVSIEEPSPVEEIGANETINPLTGEKITIPSDLPVDY